MMASLSDQDIKVLEQTRQRLAQLTSSLSNLQTQIINSDPLPPWPSLHAQTSILSQTLSSLSGQLQANAHLLGSAVVYPLPSYPGREEEPLLNQLLRKKLEPGVEEWVEQGKKAGEDIIGSGKAEEWKDLWEWAGIAGNEEARAHEWGAEGDDEESGEEGGEGNQDVDVTDRMPGIETGNETGGGKPLGIDDILRFLGRGEEPKRF
ncbi:MAG: hypothetical protein Q9163_002084 [Psora crenata]